MDFVSIVSSLGTAAGGGGIVGVLIIMYIKHQLAADRLERLQLRDQVQKLECEKFAKLERRVEEHLREDNPGAMTAKLTALTGSMERVLDKVDRVAEDVAGLREGVAANERYTRNIDLALQRLRDGGKYGNGN